MDAAGLSHFLDVPLDIEVRLDFRAMRVRDLLALEAGSVIGGVRAAGESVDVIAGEALVAQGELTAAGKKVGVRLLGFKGMN